jgi:GGDEF domain-containing protein
MWHDVLTYGAWSGEIWNKRKNGEIFPEFLKIFSIKDDQGAIHRFVGIFIDNTEMKAYQKKINTLETRDKLTGLYNRSYVTNYIDQFLKDKQTDETALTLLYMDIDAFKTLNDNLGHAVGDDILIRFATVLREVYPDHLLARVNGDEFVVVAEIEESETNQLVEILFDRLK